MLNSFLVQCVKKGIRNSRRTFLVSVMSAHWNTFVSSVIETAKFLEGVGAGANLPNKQGVFSYV